MSEKEYGLDLHEWLTRWQELEEQFETDATAALPEACDFVETMLQESGVGLVRVGGENDELIAAYEAARDVADKVERGDSVDLGDIGQAIVDLRGVHEAIVAGRRA
jgi:hypothetical protein